MVKKKKAQKSTDDLKKKLFKWAVKGIIFGIGFFALMILLVFLGLFGHLPSVKELKHIDNNTASVVYSADGVIMGGYYTQNRLTTADKDIAQYVKDALIATEDSRFFEHKGFDFISLGRVVVKSIFLFDRSQGGGSTISQQLAKNLYPRKNYGIFSLIINKIREVIIANRIEKALTKEEILTLYLNTVPFGEDVYGIEAASQRFFSKKARSLNPAESATLIGMLAANTAFNPRLNPEKSLTRRNVVLSRMHAHKALNDAELEKWKQTPIELKYNRIDQNTGLAPYFREKIRVKVEEILKQNYGDLYYLYTDGLRIHTTIDSRLQKYAETATVQHMTRLQKEFNDHWKHKEPWASKPSILQDAIKQSHRYRTMKENGYSEKEIANAMNRKSRMTIITIEGEKVMEMTPLDSVKHYLKMLNVGFMAMDSRSGHILAWVGGVNHKIFQYDHVTSKRQVGSTFKPFVYAAALLNGFKPCDYISNERRVYPAYNDWSPANSNNEHQGYYSLKGGLTHSVNTISAELIIKTGPKEVVGLARGMGIESDIPAYPAIALGAVDLSLYEMLTAYAPFSNGGYKTEPVGLLRIEDRDGKVLYNYQSDKTNEVVLDPDVAIMMAEMMKGVVEEGTGRSLRSVYGLNTDLAGKTGTTQDNADGWFIGYTPTLVAGAWVGNDVRAIHFRSTSLGQGAHTALPIFGQFMNRMENDPRFRKYTGNSFPYLPDYLAVQLECDDYSLSNPDRNFFERMFDSPSKRDTFKLKDRGDESDKKRDHQGLINRMKDLFKKSGN